MPLDRIRLVDFRNHRASELVGTRRLNLITGENGAGKTNVLEAISLFAPGRGLRGAALAEMIASEASGGFAVSAELTNTADALPSRLGTGVEPLMPTRLGTGVEPVLPTRRRVRINGTSASAMLLGEWLGIAWATPAMDRLFAESAGTRRRFLDRLVLALTPSHAGAVLRYEGALRQRNHLLALPEPPDPAWLSAIESQMAEAGAAVNAGRARAVERLDAALAAEPPSPFARPALALAPGGPSEAGALAEALAEGRGRDRAAGRSLIGPHRDDLIVTLAAKRQAAALCSTGEQKAMLIAIILAHNALAESDDAQSGAPPRPRVLLLDEVAAHLDPYRRAALFERLASGPAQVWLTGTEPEPFAAIVKTAACWRVDDGQMFTA